MLSGVGQQATFGTQIIDRSPVTPRRSDQTAALNGQIRRDQMQLDDWVTCVSAKTPKGKAEIQSLSARISAAKEQIASARADQAANRVPGPEPNSGSPTGVTASTPPAHRGLTEYVASIDSANRRSVLLNTWA